MDFFRFDGRPYCYTEGEELYSWNGAQIGFLSGADVYDVKGVWVGFLTSGTMYDRGGDILLISHDSPIGSQLPAAPVKTPHVAPVVHGIPDTPPKRSVPRTSASKIDIDRLFHVS